MIAQGQSGQITTSDGVAATMRMGQNGDQIASDLHGAYYEQTVRGNLYQLQGAATTTSAAGNATFTGTGLINPAGSGYNLVIGRVAIAQAAALTASTNIGVMYGPTIAVATNLLTPANRIAGGKASVAYGTSGGTITALTNFVIFAGSGSGAMTVPGLIPLAIHDFKGGIVIPPGSMVASYTSAASTTALLFNFEYEEVPILR